MAEIIGGDVFVLFEEMVVFFVSFVDVFDDVGYVLMFVGPMVFEMFSYKVVLLV